MRHREEVLNVHKTQMITMNKEQLFYKTLRNVFIGERIEGVGGFINLMKIKSKYYQQIEKLIKKDVEELTKKYPSFKEELYDRLYSFFRNYFSENGSIYINPVAVHNQVYERVYTDEDVSLFWKTQGLYYIKTDRIFKSLKIELDGKSVFFDASEIEYKKNNEKKSLVYEFDKVENSTLHLKVRYKEGNKKTDIESILKQAKDKSLNITEEDLERATRVFERQSEVDYFINKNARKFLKEQFDLWLYRYLTDIDNEWPLERIEQIQGLKRIAYKLIDFVGQFEEELAKIWEKPRFVRNSNYVISLDRIASKGGLHIIEKLPTLSGWKEQVEEWIELGILSEEPKNLLEGGKLKEEYRFLPVDTKYFKEIELEILGLFDNLDEELDGWLIKSENWQALNTILPKFKGKVQTIYIDPPFNKEQEADYHYIVKYKDSTWITMLENRLRLAKEFLKDSGSIFVRCDYNGNMYVRLLMNEIFGKENFRNEIIIRKGKRTESKERNRLENDTESLFLYALNKEQHFFKIPVKEKRKEELEWTTMFFAGARGDPIRVFWGIEIKSPPGAHWQFSQERINAEIARGNIKIKCKNCGWEHQSLNVDDSISMCQVCGSRNFEALYMRKEIPVNNDWTDILGYTYTVSKSTGFLTENSEILLKRVIESSSKEGNIVMDFFLGSGTTCTVAHKLKRKWIGIEVGDHFYSVVLPRIKKVFAYDSSGVSKEKDVREVYNKDNAGGFMKYYELEQFDDVMMKVKYGDDNDTCSEGLDFIIGKYIFLKDKKLTENTIEVNLEKEEVHVCLEGLYDKLDIAETISNCIGKNIKHITSRSAVYEDEEVNFDCLSYKLIKPLVWW